MFQDSKYLITWRSLASTYGGLFMFQDSRTLWFQVRPPSGETPPIPPQFLVGDPLVGARSAFSATIKERDQINYE